MVNLHRMKSTLLKVIFLALTISAFGQANTAEYYGYTHLTYRYKGDSIDILVKSKKGEENIRKPLFFFCQGSLPRPLIMEKEKGIYGVFPFTTDSLTVKYHLVIVGKPHVPLICNAKTLGEDLTYVDSTGKYPTKYSEKNLLSYYVDRNLKVLKYLRKQKWVSSKRLVIAGHSEGSTIAAKMAAKTSAITHLVYAGGNPMGRIMSMIQQDRSHETDTDSTRYTEDEFSYWQYVVENKKVIDYSQGDTPKATYEFSIPPIEYLEHLKIPVLVYYGTKDYCSPYNDLMRVNFIRQGKTNFEFKAYIGVEHNFYPVTADGKPNYDIYNWDKVAGEWLKWLDEK
jgi:dienelactone hydrolase